MISELLRSVSSGARKNKYRVSGVDKKYNTVQGDFGQPGFGSPDN